MKSTYAFLDSFDQACLNLTTEELRVKYPGIPVAELKECQRMIKELMSELNQRRFWRWIKKRSWVLYSFGED